MPGRRPSAGPAGVHIRTASMPPLAALATRPPLRGWRLGQVPPMRLSTWPPPRRLVVSIPA
eukprot:8976258-Prorocentrum_lima.AAC.1